MFFEFFFCGGYVFVIAGEDAVYVHSAGIFGRFRRYDRALFGFQRSVVVLGHFGDTNGAVLQKRKRRRGERYDYHGAANQRRRL